jgi:hypothetical protein
MICGDGGQMAWRSWSIVRIAAVNLNYQLDPNPSFNVTPFWVAYPVAFPSRHQPILIHCLCTSPS